MLAVDIAMVGPRSLASLGAMSFPTPFLEVHGFLHLPCRGPRVDALTALLDALLEEALAEDAL